MAGQFSRTGIYTGRPGEILPTLPQNGYDLRSPDIEQGWGVVT